jgi:hypothetical protein|nr:MAG TPA: hypothetical protein [Caudoviricetes sp.]
MKSFITKYVLIIITAIVIGVGVALLPLSEADAPRRWAVAYIMAMAVFTCAEVVGAALEERHYNTADVLAGIALTMYVYLLKTL